MKKNWKVAVAGATGLVGTTILEQLEKKNFPVSQLIPLASERSAGKFIEFKGESIEVRPIGIDTLSEAEIVFMAAGGEVSEQYAKELAAKGIYVIDNSSSFRMDPAVALVVPEVNPDAIGENDRLIANPNCSTIQCMPPLQVLKPYGIKRVSYATYQSVSGSGLQGLRDLDEGVTEFYPHSIKGNVLPHIDVFTENGYTKEEMKMIEETRKILELPDLRVTATTVRVPVRFAHSVQMQVELEQPFDVDQVREELRNAKNIIVKDDPKNAVYPIAEDAEGSDFVYVGRIRRDHSVDNGIHIWVVADNIRKGAATNAVQVAQIIAGEPIDA